MNSYTFDAISLARILSNNGVKILDEECCVCYENFIDIDSMDLLHLYEKLGSENKIPKKLSQEIISTCASNTLSYNDRFECVTCNSGKVCHGCISKSIDELDKAHGILASSLPSLSSSAALPSSVTLPSSAALPSSTAGAAGAGASSKGRGSISWAPLIEKQPVLLSMHGMLDEKDTMEHTRVITCPICEEARRLVEGSGIKTRRFTS